MRGHPHIHAAEFLGENGPDLYKIFQNNGQDLEEIRDEMEKMHKVFNRFVSRMNYLSQYLNTKPSENPTDNDNNMEDVEEKPWYQQIFARKAEKPPKAIDEKDKRFSEMTILQLMNTVKEKYENNDES